MPNALTVGASSGVGRALAEAPSDSYPVWTASRRNPALPAGRHIVRDVTAGEFPVEALPAELQALVYCPGTIRLNAFQRLDDSAFQQDFEVNVMGAAVRSIRAALPALKAALERHPLGRIGQLEDLVAAARYLLSDEAGWVTGQVLHVDGGMGRVRRLA